MLLKGELTDFLNVGSSLGVTTFVLYVFNYLIVTLNQTKHLIRVRIFHVQIDAPPAVFCDFLRIPFSLWRLKSWFEAIVYVRNNIVMQQFQGQVLQKQQQDIVCLSYIFDKRKVQNYEIHHAKHFGEYIYQYLLTVTSAALCMLSFGWI